MDGSEGLVVCCKMTHLHVERIVGIGYIPNQFTAVSSH